MTTRRPTTAAIVTMIGLNNRGVKLFQYGDLSSASKCFQAALGILKQELLIAQQSNKKCALGKQTSGRPVVGTTRRVPSKLRVKHLLASIPSQRRKGRRDDRTGSPEASVASSTNIRTATKREEELSRTQRQEHTRLLQGQTCLSARLQLSPHYIASKPIKIVAMGGADQARSSSGFITFAVAYNLALAHHLSGFTAEPLRARKYWRSAIAFYDIAIDLRRKASVSSCLQLEGTSLMRDLALTNNLAALHYQLGGVQRASICFQALSQRLQCLGVRQPTTEVQGFMSNLVLLNVQSQDKGTAFAAMKFATAA